ncbi:MAG: DUF86 domain-containing protein [Lachnospiraceae bacterium]|nr:DUF86 domain-containing protein [Lachnospiraceae bacterium]
MNDKDIIILKKIIQYANEIDGTITRFELDLAKFKDDYVAKNAIAMCILQIGELAGKLTERLKNVYSQMPWRDITSIRNRAAHNYGSMDVEILWGIAIANIPELKAYCNMILGEIERKT